jgi:hypothetical protein
MEYIRYEIEERKWSPNAIVGVYNSVDEHGRIKEKRDYILSAGNVGKKRGDEYAEKICTFLNIDLKNTQYVVPEKFLEVMENDSRQKFLGFLITWSAILVVLLVFLGWALYNIFNSINFI